VLTGITRQVLNYQGIKLSGYQDIRVLKHQEIMPVFVMTLQFDLVWRGLIVHFGCRIRAVPV